MQCFTGQVLVLAITYVIPQFLRSTALGCDRTRTFLIEAFGCVTEQKDKLRHATKAGSRCCGCCVAATAKAHPQGGTITTLKDGVATFVNAGRADIGTGGSLSGLSDA